MAHPITIDYDLIKNQLDNGLYESYINQEISTKKLEEILDVSNSVLMKAFRMFGFKTKTEYRHSKIKNDYFKNIHTEEQAYILGFYLADGSLSKKYNRLSFSVTKDDDEVLKIIQSAIAPDEKILYSKENINKEGYISKPMAILGFTSKSITFDLERYGIGNNKTYKTNIDISFIPENLMIHFIRGYFDGDGTVYAGSVTRKVNGKDYLTENCNWSIISHCKTHLLQIKDFLEKEYNIKANVFDDSRGNSLVAITNKEDFLKFREILYKDANFFLKRKKEKYFSYEFHLKKVDKKVKVFYNDEWIEFNNQADAGKFLGVTGTSIRNWIKKGDKAPYLIVSVDN